MLANINIVLCVDLLSIQTKLGQSCQCNVPTFYQGSRLFVFFGPCPKFTYILTDIPITLYNLLSVILEFKLQVNGCSIEIRSLHILFPFKRQTIWFYLFCFFSILIKISVKRSLIYHNLYHYLFGLVF